MNNSSFKEQNDESITQVKKIDQMNLIKSSPIIFSNEDSLSIDKSSNDSVIDSSLTSPFSELTPINSNKNRTPVSYLESYSFNQSDSFLNNSKEDDEYKHFRSPYLYSNEKSSNVHTLFYPDYSSPYSFSQKSFWPSSLKELELCEKMNFYSLAPGALNKLMFQKQQNNKSQSSIFSLSSKDVLSSKKHFISKENSLHSCSFINQQFLAKEKNSKENLFSDNTSQQINNPEKNSIIPQQGLVFENSSLCKQLTGSLLSCNSFKSSDFSQNKQKKLLVGRDENNSKIISNLSDLYFEEQRHILKQQQVMLQQYVKHQQPHTFDQRKTQNTISKSLSLNCSVSLPSSNLFSSSIYSNSSSIISPPFSNKIEEKYSRKVFVGGLPPDIDEDEIASSFRRFGALSVDWPHKSESKSYFPPKGYCFVIFEDEVSVKLLMDLCLLKEEKSFWFVSSPSTKDKPVQIRPWSLKDAHFTMRTGDEGDERRTIFVGGVPRPLKAVELALIIDRLYGGVSSANIDVDQDLKYPKGAARVSFNSEECFISAVNGRFVQLQYAGIDKRVEVKPYVLDDRVCEFCCTSIQEKDKSSQKVAPFFCSNVTCLNYFCENCWILHHSLDGKAFHKPLVKEGTDRPRVLPFK